MNRVCCVAALAAGVSLLCGVAHGVLLTNGDLELPADGGDGSMGNLATGWVLDEPDVDTMANPVNSAEFRSFGNHTPAGERGLWFRSFEGSLSADSPATVNATLRQDVAGAAGVLYELSAWFRYETFYSGGDPTVGTQTILGLAFLGAGDVSLGGVELDIDTVQMRDNVWREFSVMGVSPAGTVEVRAYASMVNGIVAGANPQSAFVDDFVLLPAPGAAMVLALGGVAMARRRR